MALSEAEKSVYVETARLLKSGERRMFMARVVRSFGPGGQRMAERELGWNRGTIRKGLCELDRGRPFTDDFSKRGRKPIEKHLPNLLNDIKEVVDILKTADPVFQQTGYYISISVVQVRECLIQWKGYADAELPTKETIRVKMHKLNYRFRRY